MSTGICPILSRFVTDLYITVPEEFSDKIKTKDGDLWDVKIDPIYIDKRMFLCTDYTCRTLLPLALDSLPEFKSFSDALRSTPEVLGVDYLAAMHDLVEEIFDAIEAVVEDELPEQKENELSWVQDVAFAVRWVIESAMCGSAIIGPLTVNVLDILSEMFEWDKMVPHALALIEKMKRVERMIN